MRSEVLFFINRNMMTVPGNGWSVKETYEAMGFMRKEYTEEDREDEMLEDSQQFDLKPR